MLLPRAPSAFLPYPTAPGNAGALLLVKEGNAGPVMPSLLPSSSSSTKVIGGLIAGSTSSSSTGSLSTQAASDERENKKK